MPSQTRSDLNDGNLQTLKPELLFETLSELFTATATAPNQPANKTLRSIWWLAVAGEGVDDILAMRGWGCVRVIE